MSYSKRRKDLEAVKAALTKAVAAVEKARQVKEEKERAARLLAEKVSKEQNDVGHTLCLRHHEGFVGQSWHWWWWVGG